MGYPIVNSVEGPLKEITPSNCTEGCITRCILKYNINNLINTTIIVYVLKLTDNLYLIDSYTQMFVIEDYSANPYVFIMPKLSSSNLNISAGTGLFPNRVQ